MPFLESELDVQYYIARLLPISLIILLQLGGLVLAIVLRKRSPRAAMLAMIAMSIAVLFNVFSTALSLTYESAMFDDNFELVDTLQSIMSVFLFVHVVADLAWMALLISAVFVDRKGAAAATISSHVSQPELHHERAMTLSTPVRSISKGLYLGLIVASTVVQWIAVIIGLVLSINARRDEEAFAALGVTCFGLVIGIVAIVMLMMLIYKFWAVIQDGHARTTPGKAVGFLFIPFFNFYWIFQAYWGFAVDYNKFIARHGVAGAPRMSEGLVLTLCILALASIIPFLGYLASLIAMVLMIVFLNTGINAVNALARVSPAARPMDILN